MAADACELFGFNLPEFPREFIADIERHFRASVIKLTNPLDLGDLFDMEVYHRIVDETLQQENVDGMVFLHTYMASTEGEQSRKLLQSVGELSHQYDKPVAVCVSADNEEVAYLKRNFHYPIFVNPVEPIQALQLSRDYGWALARPHQEEEIPTFPVEKEAVQQSMIEELRGAPILLGARGELRSDVDAVVEAILRLSQLLRDVPEIGEVDINPLRVFHEPEGCLALDARMVLKG